MGPMQTTFVAPTAKEFDALTSFPTDFACPFCQNRMETAVLKHQAMWICRTCRLASPPPPTSLGQILSTWMRP